VPDLLDQVDGSVASVTGDGAYDADVVYDEGCCHTLHLTGYHANYRIGQCKLVIGLIMVLRLELRR
jgi:hypothetical protein